MGPIEAAMMLPASLLGLLFPSRGQSAAGADSAANLDGGSLLLLMVAAAAAVGVIGAAVLLRHRSGSVQAIFFIHRDGRLVRHFTLERLLVDPVIFSGMLTAMEAFVGDSVAEGSGRLRELRFGARSFVLERGGELLAVAVCRGAPPTGLRPRLRECVSSIESADPRGLRSWDGSPLRLPGAVETRVSRLISPARAAA